MSLDVGVDPLRLAAARRAAELVRDGVVLGLGTGRTAALFVEEVGRMVAAGLRITGVATSRATERQALRLGIPLCSLNEQPRLDLTVDGADEIEAGSLNLVKGAGGALLREKLVAVSSDRTVIVADESKLVEHLGTRAVLPVEVVIFGWRRTVERLERLGCDAVRREIGGSPFVTDEGHYIVDCRFGPIASPAELAPVIKRITGVVEHGLYIGLATEAIVGATDGVRTYRPDRR